MAVWGLEAYQRFGVPDFIRPDWFAVPQLLLALAGLAATLVEAVYLAFYAGWGRIWRRFRGVSITYAVLASAWMIVWLTDRFILDAAFLDWELAPPSARP
jgi:hypothetical protein